MAQINRILKRLGPVPNLADRCWTKELLNVLAGPTRARVSYIGPAYRFPQLGSRLVEVVHLTHANLDIAPGHDAELIEYIHLVQPYIAKVVDGRIVSTCQTVRRAGIYVEAGVQTAERYRGHGYGAEVVLEWAREALQMGLVPLYSTSWDNMASLSLAKRLGLIQFASEASIADFKDPTDVRQAD